MHPADELAQVQAELRRLRARETELRNSMEQDSRMRFGRSHEIKIVPRPVRVFCKERLPRYVLDDPNLWQVQTHFEARAVPIAASGDLAGSRADRDGSDRAPLHQPRNVA